MNEWFYVSLKVLGDYLFWLVIFSVWMYKIDFVEDLNSWDDFRVLLPFIPIFAFWLLMDELIRVSPEGVNFRIWKHKKDLDALKKELDKDTK